MRSDLIVFLWVMAGLVLAASLSLFGIFVALFDPAAFVAFLRSTKERARWLRARLRRKPADLLDVFEREVADRGREPKPFARLVRR